MSIPKPMEYLDSEHIQYQVINHPRSFTARATAHSAHLSSQIVSKVVIVEADHRLCMVIIPSNALVSPILLANEIKATEIRLVPEQTFRDRFPGCEIGAMSPLGNLYGMEVYIAHELFERLDIIFNGGTHTQLVRMNTVEFCELSHAKVIYKGYKSTVVHMPIRRGKKRAWHWI